VSTDTAFTFNGAFMVKLLFVYKTVNHRKYYSTRN